MLSKVHRKKVTHNILPRIIYLCILIFGFTPSVFSQNKIKLSENSEISLITNTPWAREIYALFGHTALRVSDPKNNIDIIFNYGTFDFSSPNFMYRFVKGETDYWVSPTNFQNYLSIYKSLGVGITEQVLNLNQDQKQNIFNDLVINSLPENKVYRYNYFFDNCSTRPRNIVFSSIQTTTNNPDYKDESFRDLIHDLLQNHKWIIFGIDLLLDAGADRTITDREKDFLPHKLLESFENTSIINTNGENIDLVKKTITLNKSENNKGDSTFFSPLVVGLILLIITVIISYLAYNKFILLGKIYDTLLFFVAGICGTIILFMMLFSEHPCTDNNWNIVWLNPFQLLFSLLFLIKPLTKCVYYYHFINFVVLTLFFLAWFLIPQQLSLAFIPYIASIWLRSGMNVNKYRKK